MGRRRLGFLHFYTCTGSCEPGSRCHPNECIFGGEKARGIVILELGVDEQGQGNGEFSLQAIGDQGGRILSQQGGFQVSEGEQEGTRGARRARGISKRNDKARGIRHVHIIMLVYINKCL